MKYGIGKWILTHEPEVSAISFEVEIYKEGKLVLFADSTVQSKSYTFWYEGSVWFLVPLTGVPESEVGSLIRVSAALQPGTYQWRYRQKGDSQYTDWSTLEGVILEPWLMYRLQEVSGVIQSDPQNDPQHFHYEIIDNHTGTNVLAEMMSWDNSTGFQFFDGSGWKSIPEGGVPHQYYGNEWRYRQEGNIGGYRCELKAEMAHEGPQILLTWEEPLFSSEISEVALVRRLLTYPESLKEGKLIYQGVESLRKYADKDLVGNDCYYYTIFSKAVGGKKYMSRFRQYDGTGFTEYTNIGEREIHEEWICDEKSKAHSITVETGYFQEKLFDVLPNLYQVADKKEEQGGIGQDVLTEEIDEEGEHYNIHEDGVTAKGQLERLLKLEGVELDRIKGLIGYLAKVRDVDSTPPDFLPKMNELLGLVFNYDLPILKQREEIKAAVESYKIKGMIDGLSRILKAISGGEPEVFDHFNAPTGVTVQLNEVYVRLRINFAEGIESKVIDKMRRVFPYWVPIGLTVGFLLAEYGVEEITRVTLDDSYTLDEVKGVMLSNKLTKVTNHAEIVSMF